MVTFLSPLDDKCKAVVSKIQDLSNEFTTVKFYQVDVGKHAMLSSALLITELPVIVFVKNGADVLTLGPMFPLRVFGKASKRFKWHLNESRVLGCYYSNIFEIKYISIVTFYSQSLTPNTP